MARNNAPQTAAFARRVVCRALTVLGGVATGTALAWWLSSTAASAETTVPTVDDAPATVQQVVAPVEQPLDVVARQLQDPPPAPKDTLAALGQQVTDAAGQVRVHADDRLPTLPSCSTVCQDTERYVYTLGGVAWSDLPAVPGTPAVMPLAPTVVPGVAVDALVPNTAKDRAFADGMSRRGSPAPAQATPGLPNWPAPIPFVPTGVPTTGNHGSAGNAADAHLIAVLPWHGRNPHLVTRGIAATTRAATSGRPSAQPGVLPD